MTEPNVKLISDLALEDRLTKPSGLVPELVESPAIVVAGLGLVGVGFGMITLAWGRVAGLDDVQAQLPWGVGGSALGLALIITGLTVVSAQTRRREASAEARQLAAIVALVSEAADAMDLRDRASEDPSRNGAQASTRVLRGEPTPQVPPR